MRITHFGTDTVSNLGTKIKKFSNLRLNLRALTTVLVDSAKCLLKFFVFLKFAQVSSGVHTNEILFLSLYFLQTLQWIYKLYAYLELKFSEKYVVVNNSYCQLTQLYLKTVYYKYYQNSHPHSQDKVM